MFVKGSVESIVYYNDQNGYAVIRVETESDTIVCVGNMPIMAVGEVVALEGKMVAHPKYGEQFLVQSFQTESPKSKEGIIKYLSSGLIKGIGEATARKIYATFGSKTMDILENTPEQLATIKGISVAKAQVMSDCYTENKKMQNQIIFLQGYNISINTAIKIYNVYKDATKEIVKENPYRLVDDIDGIGFITADKIARNMGIDEDSPFRIRAGIIYSLKENAEKQGNTYLSYEELKDKASNVLSLNLDEMHVSYEDIIARLVLDTVIKDFERMEGRCIALSKYYNTEKSIATALVRLNNEAVKIESDLVGLVKEFEAVNNIKFHPSQIDAVISAVTNGVTVITGGPGTGKTTIVKCIAYIFDTLRSKVEYCSPTGRASKRLSQATGKEAKTIHRLLGMNAQSGQLNFAYNQYNPLNADVVIVDEVSMVDVSLMNSLLKALQKGTRLLLVGDKDQLPSVGAGNVLSDIIHSEIIEVKYLTHIYRQSADSLIITNAHLINQGKMPVINNSSKDFFVIEEQPSYEMVDTIVNLVSSRLPAFSDTNSFDIQVLGPLKSGVAGIENINKRIQASINPPRELKNEIRVGDTLFRVGDRVMQIANDYQMEWTRIGQYGAIESGEGVFNGDIGFITAIDTSENYVEVTFDDDRTTQYSPIDLYNLQLAYAITIHKSQGSEFDVLIVSLTNGPPTILNKNLLYTAVTRAKKLVVLVTSKKILSMTVHNNYIAQRLTMLKRFLIEEDDKYKKLVYNPID